MDEEEEKYWDYDDDAPAPRSRGKAGRRLGSLNDLAKYHQQQSNGAKKRLN